MAMKHSADVIVVGLGIIGSGAALELSRRGLKVVALDAFPPKHTNGASHGQSRIIRKAYFEAPEYVPLLHRTYDMWRQLEQDSGRYLMTLNGALFVGALDCQLVAGSLNSAKMHGLEHELLNPEQLSRKFPAWRLPTDMVAVYEPGAGTLHADQCWTAQLTLAQQAGAHLRFAAPVVSWSATKSSVSVKTQETEYVADKLVLCPGPWAPELLGDLDVSFRIQRVVNAFFQPVHPETMSIDKFPGYCIDIGGRFYYGLPAIGQQGLKVGRHDAGATCTAKTVNRVVDEQEIEELRAVVDDFLPGQMDVVLDATTCLYTLTPDEHFVIDAHPVFGNVFVAAGFSGHGFKFGPVVGEILADLVVAGSTSHAIDCFAINRSAVRLHAAKPSPDY